MRRILALLLLIWGGLHGVTSVAADQPPKKIVLIAGTKSHGPGHHEYEKGMRVIKHCLDRAPNLKGIRCEIHLDGWPQEESTLDDADSIVLFCDGSDHDVAAHPLLRADRLEVIRKQMQRGCGLVAIHYTVFVPIGRGGEDLLDWIGGFFDYESGPPPRNWYSKIQTANTTARPATPNHPISRGLVPFELREEYYYNIRFRENDPRFTPILVTPLPNEPKEEIVAWAVERPDGGRGFGFTGGHFHDNWNVDNYRRMLLNAIVWTAHIEVPPDGIISTMPADEELEKVAIGTPIRTLLLTGHQHPAHAWQETTPALCDVLTQLDRRFELEVQEDPEYLATGPLADYDVIVFNYCNWQKPGLTTKAKERFTQYLREGGGLSIIHFSNGAFHFSLPEAGDSDWPLWRTEICRRVWDHTPGTSGHDAYGPFTVDIPRTDHPITAGLKAFPTVDELYFRQQGDLPIEVLATARSQVTGAHEPMAFTANFGEGRIFQTVLGHAAETIRNPGTATLIARGTAWAAGRTPTARMPEGPISGGRASQGPASVAGKFGQALDLRKGGLEVPHQKEFQSPPLTVECWAKLQSKAGFNILLAQNPKESADHWEMYTYAGAGDFSVYLPGYSPAEIRSGVDITGGDWHHVAMTFDGHRVGLYVDGRLTKIVEVKRVREGGPTGPLWIGQIPPGLGCDGYIDDIRISSGIRMVQLPNQPLNADEMTIGLWSLDQPNAKGSYEDASQRMQPAGVSATGAAPAEAKDHFGEEEVGFRWTEEDSRDDRWQRMDTGTFFSGSIATPKAPTQKGIVIRVGAGGEGAMCYDTELLRVSAAWSGGFLEFNSARFGLIAPPAPAGKIAWSNPALPGWAKDGNFADPREKPYGPMPGDWAKYQRLYRHGDRVVLGYRVGQTEILESPWLERAGDTVAFTRTLQVAPASGELVLRVAGGDAFVELRGEGASIERQKGQSLLRIAPHDKPLTLKLYIAAASSNREALESLVRSSKPPEDLSRWTKPGPAQWTVPIETIGKLGEGEGPYLVDTLTLPFSNPYGALFFTSGHDFFANGDAAVSTVHGDVWIVSGLDNDLGKLSWKRFATGLFQPLGIKIVGEQVYVLGRDQITLLKDTNRDGEADVYECFNNAGQVTMNAHEFATCLETDSDGNFYYLRGDSEGKTEHDGCLLKVSKDGSKLEVVATGIRNGNGLAIGPDDVITVAPQEGTWTPASALCEVRPGGFYGAMQSHHREVPPESYDPPLCWIPRLQDNSSGGQCWVTGDHWGPLAGQLLHFSFGRCKMFLVLREQVDGITQGGTVELPLDFDSGVMRGRFHPRDGQLYVTGLKGWVSSAVQDGCFHRVRYVGGPVHLPTQLKVLENGIAITFAEPLDKSSGEDPGNFDVQRWSYRWSSNYGSPEYSVREPNQEGRDAVTVASATLFDDQRTVFLEIPDLAPVMQMGIRYALRSQAGAEFSGTIYHTIHRLGSESIAKDRLTPPPRKEWLAPSVEERLQPGLLVRAKMPSQPDGVGLARLPALAIPDRRGASAITFAGYLAAPLKGSYRFRVKTNGVAALRINGQTYSTSTDVEIPLLKGFNQFEVASEPPTQGPFHLLTYWQSRDFPEEPIPPGVLFHDPSEADWAQERRILAGAELGKKHQCLQCHEPTPRESLDSLFAIEWKAPRLVGVGQRLKSDWLAAWILDPRGHRPAADMPRMLGSGKSPEARQQSIDLAAYLSGGATDHHLEMAPLSQESVERGEILFEDLGCIACHHFRDVEEEPEQRLSLHYARSKFTAAGLADYLRDPTTHHPTTRMPKFDLKQEEVEELASYIFSAATGEVASIEEGGAADPARGERLYQSLQCARCHEGSSSEDSFVRLPLRVGAVGGCLAPVTAGNRRAPDFGFNDSELDALRAWLGSPAAAERHPYLAELATTRFVTRSLDCAACHPRDGAPGRLAEVLSEESIQGLLPEHIPDLSLVGWKLQPTWSQRLFAGELQRPTRPWLRARMPAFPSFASTLSHGLASEHGFHAPEEQLRPDPGLAVIGERLTQKNVGFDCRECHGVGSDLPTGGKETLLAPGINFADIPGRLRGDFYHRFMLDPFRYNPRAKMPKFAEDGKRTKVVGILDGDAAQQFDAIWHYLNRLPDSALTAN